MKTRMAASSFCLFMGVSMIGIWVMFYLTGSIPEVQTKPIELGLHIAAEMLTAIVLITSGIGLVKRRGWARDIFSISMGMLLYTLIMSPGYFAQRGELAFVGMFSLFIIIALVLTVLVLVFT